jgi:hypothetical protein
MKEVIKNETHWNIYLRFDDDDDDDDDCESREGNMGFVIRLLWFYNPQENMIIHVPGKPSERSLHVHSYSPHR